MLRVCVCMHKARTHTHAHTHTHTHLETQTQNNKEPIINKRNLITYHAYNIKTKQPKQKNIYIKTINTKESKRTTQTRKYKV